MRKLSYSLLTFMVVVLTSCSKSEDSTETSTTINASFTFSQTQVWPERYKIIFAAFGKDTLNPLVNSEISNPGDNVATTATLDKVPESATLVKLYIANQANQPIFTLFRKGITVTASPDELPNEAVALLTFQRIQSQVFTSCVTCHGGSSGGAEASLFLTPTASYANLVAKVSTNSSKQRVVASNVSESFLIDVLRNKQSKFVHSASSSIAEEDIVLVEKWITKGALND